MKKQVSKDYNSTKSTYLHTLLHNRRVQQDGGPEEAGVKRLQFNLPHGWSTIRGWIAVQSLQKKIQLFQLNFPHAIFSNVLSTWENFSGDQAPPTPFHTLVSFPSPRLDPHRFHSRQHNNDLSRSGFFPPWNHNCSGFVAGMHGAAFFASGQGGAGQKKIFWGCSRVGNSQTRGIFGVGRAGTVLKIFGARPAIFPRARAGLASLVHCAHQLGKSRL